MSRIVYGTINDLVKQASYAVRGRIVARAQELQKQGRNTISCNIGNPHSLGQPSISYIRNVLALMLAPQAKIDGFKDQEARAHRYRSSISDIGAYTDSQGILAVREDVCKFLYERDKHEASPENIFLTNGITITITITIIINITITSQGASEAVRLCMQTIIRNPESGFKDGVLTPIPQYPLYSALSSLLGAQLVPYYLDESNSWGCSTKMLSEALASAKQNGVTTRALVGENVNVIYNVIIINNLYIIY